MPHGINDDKSKYDLSQIIERSSKVGSGNLDTIAQTIIPAINEINAVKARFTTTDGWACLILGNYIIASKQVVITPQAARETYNMNVNLPYTMANSNYYVQMTPNSRVEADVFNFGAQRTSTEYVTLHVFSSSTASKYFFVTVLGQISQ